MSETRANLIAEAIIWAGRKAQGISLNTAFDEILRDMTRLYPILRGSQEGSTVASQDYIPLPSDYRSKRFLILDLTSSQSQQMEWLDPDPFKIYVKTNTITPTYPEKFTVIKEESKIFLEPTPDAIYTYYFAYDKIHPKAGRQLAFTSGGTYVPSVGQTITGHTSSATGVISDIQISSGKWADGDAAGKFTLSSQTGTFQSENLDIGTELNIATISGDSTTVDNFVHYLEDEFEEAIKAGLAYRACELIQDIPWMQYWYSKYKNILAVKAGMNFRIQPSMKSNFWEAIKYGKNY